ncbi:putative transporter YIL166C [Colletotrichum liriopes]|uniref:Transporter YIL166C n=1 Tax=Colletotrichum liriopes TaxID=708192 RepID=A0AA37GX07_9PEZI|nr:putative transporter YIL166C [Colletotrichum liriopes]
MSSQQPVAKASPPGSITSSDHGALDSKTVATDDKRPIDSAPPTAPALATQETQRMEAALGDAILRFLRIRKGPKNEEYDLDAVWACIMFASLNIDRNNISNAVSDNMLDDLGLTRGDYSISELVSPPLDLYPCAVSWVTKDGGGCFSLILVGLASFFLMPQCPAKTKSWWNPKGYFTEKEEKIIVNSVIRDDPQKGGMYNRQGLSVRQIWECSKDYDMWPLYALGLLFGLPKYPVNQYLTLSLRDLDFNVIQSNLLSIPNIVGSSITMLLITAVSELLNNRSFVAMAEDAWLLPCFVALIALPDPIGPWVYFAIATVLLSFPYTHPIQVAWTSRNAGSVQNRTVSASLYNMWVQVSGMIGANIYQPDDAPRYFKANKGLLVICIWMCLVQYPFTYFYYRWRNNSKAKKWDAMTPEQQHDYRTNTTDQGNKRLDFRFAT